MHLILKFIVFRFKFVLTGHLLFEHTIQVRVRYCQLSLHFFYDGWNRVFWAINSILNMIELFLESINSCLMIAHLQMHVLYLPIERFYLRLDCFFMLNFLCLQLCNFIVHDVEYILIFSLLEKHRIVQLFSIYQTLLQALSLPFQPSFRLRCNDRNRLNHARADLFNAGFNVVPVKLMDFVSCISNTQARGLALLALLTTLLFLFFIRVVIWFRVFFTLLFLLFIFLATVISLPRPTAILFDSASGALIFRW